MKTPLSDLSFRYKMMSVDHLSELQEDIDRLKREGVLSSNEIYRSYLRDKSFKTPENLPDAKSLIIIGFLTN